MLNPRGSALGAHNIEATLRSLLNYCETNGWSGYDPYDALNSRVFRRLPGFLNCRVSRLILTQTLKRSPVNIRPFLLVPKVQNAKAIALFITALLKLSNKPGFSQDGVIELLVDRLEKLRSEDRRYWSWGYSFPWQTRSKVVPVGTANMVSTTFAANALLDAYEKLQIPHCLTMAISAAEYLIKELYWTKGTTAAGLSYPLPGLQAEVHNANFLGAALLCRVYRHTGEPRFLQPAMRVTEYSIGKQHSDGSWYYGEADSQKWIDNFHTGYNLTALRSIGRTLNTSEFNSHIQRGLDFYRGHFFRTDGAPRYYHNNTYPIDIHSAAQSIITLLEFDSDDESNSRLAASVFQWTMDNMWDPRGFFYYRVLRYLTIRTPYMRWSEAWMVLALTTMLMHSNDRRVTDPLQPIGRPVSD